MKSLADMSIELPRNYEALRKFIDNNVLGERKEEVVHPSEGEQREFVATFGADFEEEKVRQIGMQDLGEWADSRSAINEEPCFPPVVSVVPAAPGSQSIKPLCPQTMAGCVWDAVNWSCAYDVVFMSFWSIYKKFPPSWRDKWIRQAPKWNDFFKTAFDSLIAMAQNERTSQAALSREFTAFRNTFRNQLSKVDPYFKRFGRVRISVSRVLGHIFSSSTESQPYLDQVLVCSTCGGSTNARCFFGLLGSIELLNKYLNEGDKAPRLPLDVAVACYVQHASLEPHRSCCPTCSGLVKVQSLSIPETYWFWIELCGPISPISPSPCLVFDIQDQHQSYTLQAIIYGDNTHFTARLSDQSGAWWKYDGMWKPNVLQPDHIEGEVDLLENDNRLASCLLYCRADIQD